MGLITFNGKSSKGIFHVEVPPNYEIAERSYDTQSVPGRNGDLSIDQGCYKNVPRTYEIAFGAEGANFATLASAVSDFLASTPGYLRLEDTYNTDHYVLARYMEQGNLMNILMQAGRATITFDRKPQRFLKSGETVVRMTSSPATITNPTTQVAKPIIRVNGNGNGVLKIGKYEVTITGMQNYLFLDSETEDATKDQINLNPNISCKDRLFPVLPAGRTTVTFTGGITSVEITPRWWKV